MAAILTLIDGQTALTAVYFNQLKDALAAHLGITDDATTSLGRLVLPTAAVEQEGPSEGQVYFDTVKGYPLFRGPVAYEPIRGMRQIIEATTAAGADIVLGAVVDTTIISQAITTTGGDIIVMAHVDYIAVHDGTAASLAGVGLHLTEDGVDIEAELEQRYYLPSETQYGQMTFFRIRQKPAGTYTYALLGMRLNISLTTGTLAYGGTDNSTLLLMEI